MLAPGRAWADLTATHIFDPIRVHHDRVKEKREKSKINVKERKFLDSDDPFVKKYGVKIKSELVEKSDLIEMAIFGYAKENKFGAIVIRPRGMTE